LSNSFTLTSTKTEDKLTELTLWPEKNIPPNLGELEELLLEFPELEDPEPTDLDKPLSVTCVEKEECSLP